MEEENLNQYLASYLSLKSISNNSLYYKTGIDPNRISKVRNPKKLTISADEFYLIALAIEADIDEMAAYVFQEFLLKDKVSGINNTDYDSLSKFGQFLSDGLIFQRTVSRRTNIKESKLSVLMNDKESSPLAKDVYLTALAIREKPSDAFKFISGHLQVNSPERQEELRLEYEAKLAAAKAKRDAEKDEK